MSTPHPNDPVDLVTGAFGNTGSAIAARLATNGRAVRTLTNHPADDRRGIDVRPLTFDDPAALVAAFEGVDTFYDTYWMRHGDARGSYDLAARRCEALVAAAESGGVRRIVHLSVANPSLDSRYPYFAAKARVERRLEASPVPTLAVRPALIFGAEPSMVSDLAWLLRRVPVMGVAGDGRYRVRPVHVDDVAKVCVDTSTGGAPHHTIDAVGPDRPTFDELVRAVADAVGRKARLVHLPPGLVLAAGKALARVARDDLLTRDELLSTIDGLADTDGPATGSTSVMAWLEANGSGLGVTRSGERAHRSPATG